jgi:hypothetical protein
MIGRVRMQRDSPTRVQPIARLLRGDPAMPKAKVIDVQAFINSHKLSSVQVVLLVLCFLIVAIDGFDRCWCTDIPKAVHIGYFSRSRRR